MIRHFFILCIFFSFGCPTVFAQIFFAPGQTISVAEALNPMKVFAADLDGDGFTDVLVASSADNEISWYRNDGFGNFGEQQLISTLTIGTNAVYAADLDGDGDADVLSASYTDNTIAWFENDGTGNFGTIQTISVNANGARAVIAEDLDGDGDKDVLSASHNDNKVAWYENDGAGNFGPQQVITNSAFGTHAIYSLDLDNDGDADVLSASFYDNKIAWYENDGSGNFGGQLILSTDINGAWSVYAADLDGDGDPEVLGASGGGNLIAWFENFGNGIFGPLQIITTEAELGRAVFAADLDNDGDMDVLTASHIENKIAWYENEGAANFGPQQIIGNQAIGPNSIFVADLDADGDLDVLSTSTFDNKIVWYENIPFTETNPVPPVAAFATLPLANHPDTLYLCSGQNIQFFNQSQNTGTFLWDFGNGHFSNTANPVYTYPQPGIYSVFLTAIHPVASLNDTANLVIVVENSPIPGISCPSTVCFGTNTEYTTEAGCTAYLWEISGGTITGGQGTPTITVIWNNPPMGTISLTTDCGDSYCQLPSVASVPIIDTEAAISGQPLFCIYETLAYSAPVFGGTNYQWSITPPTAGTILSGQGSASVVIQWNTDAAILQVSYQHYLLDCNGEAALSVSPKPAFEVVPVNTACLEGQTIFSVNVPFQMNWAVTGGSIISGQNTESILVSWNVPGTAMITAVPLEADIFCNEVAYTFTEVLPALPIPTIFGNDVVCPLETYLYSVPSAQNNTQYFWNITGGSIVEGQTSPVVTVQWDNSGVYELSVYAQSTTSPFCVSESAEFNPQPLSSAPFSINGNAVVCPESVYTYNITTPTTNADYVWSIVPNEAGQIVQGQGSSEAQVLWQTPASAAVIHAFFCGETTSFPVTIDVIPQPFISQTDTLCLGSAAQLMVADANAGVDYLSWFWQNENNEPLSELPILEVFSEGVYHVQVSNAAGCMAQTEIRVNGHTAPVAEILTPGATVCIENPLDIPMFAVDGTNYIFEWMVNDALIEGADTPFLTHVSDTTLQEFNYQVLVTDTTNTCEILSGQLNILQISCPLGPPGPTDPTDPPLPPPPFLCPPVEGFTVDFDLNIDGNNCNTVYLDQLSEGDFIYFTIYWGDGTIDTLAGTTASHTYSTYITNVYNITLVGYFIHPETGNTCLTSSFTTHNVPLVARFDFAAACLGQEWGFQDHSYYLPTTFISSWIWDFGDGTTPFSGSQTETHVYTQAGTYSPSLTVSNGNCAVSAQQTFTISDSPNAGFTVAGGTCAGSFTQFVPDNTNYYGYFWNFGETTTEVKSPVFSFPEAGIYTVELQVTDEQGCISPVVSQDVVIQNPPEPESIVTSGTLFCSGNTAILNAPEGGIAYQWSSGQNTQQINIGNSGSYWVNVSLPNGCHYTTPPVEIQVIPSPELNLSPEISIIPICSGDTMTLQVTEQPTYTYQWMPGFSNTHQLEVTTSGVWEVTVTDTLTGCFTAGLAETQLQNQIAGPVVVFQEATICEGETTLAFIASFTNPNHQYVWTNGMTGTEITLAAPGNYGAVAVDQFGCTSDTSDIVSLSVSQYPDFSEFPAGCYAICHGEIIGVPAGVAQSYQWYYNGNPIFGATGNEYMPQAVGDYWVEMINAGNCAENTGTLQLNFLTDCFPPLPVSLTEFSGKVLPESNLLDWTTASETNAAFFTLQSSSNGQDFFNLAQIPASGNSSTARHYQYTHHQPNSLTYYRLLQTDFDGILRQVGSVISLLRLSASTNLKIKQIYPNPAQNSVQIIITSDSLQPVTFCIYDLTGRVVLCLDPFSFTGDTTLHLDLHQQPAGVYLLSLNNGESMTLSKLIKEK